MVWLLQKTLANPIDLKITEKHNLKPAAFKSNDLFKIELDKAVHDSKYLFFFASSPGEIELESSQSDGESVTHLCSGHNEFTCIFNMNETKALIDSPAGFRFKAKSISNPDADVHLAVYAGDYIILQNMTRQTVLLKDIENLHALVNFESTSDAEKVRIQMKAHAKREFASMEAYLNYEKEEFPSPQTHDFQFAHMDSFRSGFVAYTGENVFCGYGKNCSYRLLIETDGISSFQFSVVQGVLREKIETEFRYVN